MSRRRGFKRRWEYERKGAYDKKDKSKKTMGAYKKKRLRGEKRQNIFGKALRKKASEKGSCLGKREGQLGRRLCEEQAVGNPE